MQIPAFIKRFAPEIAGFFVLILVVLIQPKAAKQLEIASVSNPIKPVAAIQIEHLKTPEFVKGLYMTAATAMTPAKREVLIDLIDRTELNSVVIDIRDDFGRIAYPTHTPELKAHEAEKIYISDIQNLIQELHRKKIYVIARQFVFQDRALVETRPDLAVQKVGGGIWKDHKGVSWIEAGAKEAWDYNVMLARDAYETGFDEIQLDYIRFPSDGNMALATYRYYDAAKETKADVMAKFFAFVDDELRAKGIPISADLFGFAYWDRDNDLTIGQRIRDAAPHFTALSPMTYPSHYPRGTLDFQNPSDHPYEIITETLKRGATIMKEWPEVKYATRPWIQDFDIGADYTAKLIQDEMRAVVDNGGSGWLLWNARNVYTEDALAKD